MAEKHYIIRIALSSIEHMQIISEKNQHRWLQSKSRLSRLDKQACLEIETSNHAQKALVLCSGVISCMAEKHYITRITLSSIEHMQIISEKKQHRLLQSKSRLSRLDKQACQGSGAVKANTFIYKKLAEIVSGRKCCLCFPPLCLQIFFLWRWVMWNYFHSK